MTLQMTADIYSIITLAVVSASLSLALIHHILLSSLHRVPNRMLSGANLQVYTTISKKLLHWLPLISNMSSGKDCHRKTALAKEWHLSGKMISANPAFSDLPFSNL